MEINTNPINFANDSLLQPSRSISNYKILELIGLGTFGKVFKSQVIVPPPNSNLHKNDLVAVKRIELNQEKYEFPITALREIQILKDISHPNIVKIHEIVFSKPSAKKNDRCHTYIIQEYVNNDMNGLILERYKFEKIQIKYIMYQLLNALMFLDKHSIMHRDIKWGNILYGNDGIIKLTDFGLAKYYRKDQTNHHTLKVVTLWYRAPEILLGYHNYSTKADMWSAGCCFGELLKKETLFKGQNEAEQLKAISRKCGAITEENCSGCSHFKLFQDYIGEEFLKCGNQLRNEFKTVLDFSNPEDLDCFDLLSKMLDYDPEKRISAENAINHPYFTKYSFDQIKSKIEMPKISKNTHEYTVRLNYKNANKKPTQIPLEIAEKRKYPYNDNYWEKGEEILKKEFNKHTYYHKFPKDNPYDKKWISKEYIPTPSINDNFYSTKNLSTFQKRYK